MDDVHASDESCAPVFETVICALVLAALDGAVKESVVWLKVRAATGFQRIMKLSVSPLLISKPLPLDCVSGHEEDEVSGVEL
jgi:hypothetical protein